MTGPQNTLLIIDPQNDFMEGGAFAVDGATKDMQRVANLINLKGHNIDKIHVTMDSHHVLDVAHPSMWVDAYGNTPPPFTIITHENLKQGAYMPRDESLMEHMLQYTFILAEQDNYPLILWPEHCLIGTPGHAVQADLYQALANWERNYHATVGYVSKGENQLTEHYGALEAEVPLQEDPYTGLNTYLLNELLEAEQVIVAGEASSHCVKATVEQIAKYIGNEHIGKFILLEDCMSPVAKVGDGPDFPAIAEQFLQDMDALGMTIATSRLLLP